MVGGTKETAGIKTDPNPVVQWAGPAGIAGPIIWWIGSIGIGLLRPTYDPVSHQISYLSAVGAPYAGVQQLNFYILGVSVIVLALGLFVWSNRGWRLLIGVPLLVVFGAGVIMGGFFQLDPNNLQATTTRYHETASLVAFPAAVLGISITSWGLNYEDRWPNYRNRFVPLGIAILAFGLMVWHITSVSSGSEGPAGGLAGLNQRLFLLVLTGWVAYHAYKLRTLTRT